MTAFGSYTQASRCLLPQVAAPAAPLRGSFLFFIFFFFQFWVCSFAISVSFSVCQFWVLCVPQIFKVACCLMHFCTLDWPVYLEKGCEGVQPQPSVFQSLSLPSVCLPVIWFIFNGLIFLHNLSGAAHKLASRFNCYPLPPALLSPHLSHSLSLYSVRVCFKALDHNFMSCQLDKSLDCETDEMMTMMESTL